MISYIRVTKKQIINALTNAPVGKRFTIVVVPSDVHPAYDYTGEGKRLAFRARAKEESSILDSLLFAKTEVLEGLKVQEAHYYIQVDGI